MKISFDFDSTLDQSSIQDLARVFIKEGNEVQITTSRRDKDCNVKVESSDVFEVAEELGINKIVFTNYEDKVEYVRNFDLHFDDDEYEIEQINNHVCKCIGVLVTRKRDKYGMDR